MKHSNSYCQPDIKLKVKMEEKNISQPAGSPNDVVKGLFVGKNIFQPIGDVKGLTVVNQRPALDREWEKRGKGESGG